LTTFQDELNTYLLRKLGLEV